ncbi:MAG: protein kinase [Polyangiaceae bacterium]|jgi:serine/threonine-protein kinase
MTLSKRHEPRARLGPYQIVRSLGVGGMASVYEARHIALGKRVAIKVLHEHLLASGTAAARFTREGRAASSIRHPNVVEVFEVGLHAGSAYLVMELLEGQDLGTFLRTRGSLSASDAVDILLPTTSAVSAAHAAGVIHRDLKPRNIFLARERRTGVRPKVLDFGISAVANEANPVGLTESGALLGTLEYMAPEQARSARNADERSDQYALGVILYEAVAGRKPFVGNGTYELLHAIVTAPFAPPRVVGADIDSGLEEVIVRAMSRDPRARFPSVRSLGSALLPFASDAMRASWHEDFEPESGRAVSMEQSDESTRPGSEVGNRTAPVSTTLPEESVRRRRTGALVRLRAAFGALVAALAMALAWGVRGSVRPGPVSDAPGVAQRQAGSALPAEAQGPEERADTEKAAAPAPASASSTLAVPVVATPAPGRFLGWRHPDRVSIPPTPSASSPGVSRPAIPPPPSRAPSVERGYNGAPIIE